MSNPAYSILKSHARCEDFYFNLCSAAERGLSPCFGILNESDRLFAQSVYGFYQEKGFNTPKQVMAILRMFKKYQDKAEGRDE